MHAVVQHHYSAHVIHCSSGVKHLRALAYLFHSQMVILKLHRSQNDSDYGWPRGGPATPQLDAYYLNHRLWYLFVRLHSTRRACPFGRCVCSQCAFGSEESSDCCFICTLPRLTGNIWCEQIQESTCSSCCWGQESNQTCTVHQPCWSSPTTKWWTGEHVVAHMCHLSFSNISHEPKLI